MKPLTREFNAGKARGMAGMGRRFDNPKRPSYIQSMTSRERVLTAFAQREPDRVPAWCGGSPSHDYLLPETPVENVLAMYETVREYGGYR